MWDRSWAQSQEETGARAGSVQMEITANQRQSSVHVLQVVYPEPDIRYSLRA